MSQACIKALNLHASEVLPVKVEVDISPGIPQISIVGMADQAIREASLRVRTALKASGYQIPRAKILVNLSPSGMRKSGSGFDLAIALGILQASGQIFLAAVKDSVFVGELSLEGQIHPVKGMVAYEVFCKQNNLSLISGAKQGEFCSIKDLDRKVLHTLRDIEKPLQTLALFSRRKNEHEQKHDYREIYGQNLAKRALLICAVGRHNALCIGSAGSGKSMLIERFVGILPALTEEQSIETAFIHSIKGLEVDEILQGIPPLRAPHHAIGKAGLIGGGIPVAPGEISLAHNGVLFMDEFPEFSSAVLQNLRQPMERGFIRFNRSHKSYEFNARFILLAAANPCPCGNLFEKDTPCTCKESAITRYQSKMAGPLLDRFDLTIEVKRPDSQKILYEKSPLSTREMKVQVLKAHDFRQDRKKQLDISEKLSERDRVLKACRLSKRNLALVEKLSSYHKLSARSIIRVLKVSRSIADFELSQEVLEEHLLEAVAYKVGF